ncbi:MAG: hypothetical protein ABIR15_13145 [Chitinophagaceae bacterium]
MLLKRDKIKFEPGQGSIAIFAFIVFGAFLFISLIKSHSYAMDETVFHYPNVLNFYKNGLAATFNKEYSAANTPLPYIIVAAVSKLFTPGIALARIVTAFFSFLTFLLGMRILARLNVAPLYSLILLFYPYFFLNSFVFYVINFGLFFCLAALLLLNNTEKNYWNDLGAGVSLTLAILCQQFYLMLLAAVLLVRFLQYIKEREIAGSLQRFIASSFLLGLPALVPLAVFYGWGGLVHPNFNVHKLSFFPTALTGILMVTGFYFAPFAVQSIKKSDKWQLAGALLGGAVLAIGFRPAYNDFNGPGIFNGIVFHIIEIVSKKMALAGTAMMIFLCGMGLLVFYKLAATKKNIFDAILFTGCVLLAAAYTMNAIIGERHLLPLFFLLFFLILPRLKLGTVRAYLPFMFAFGVGYYFYWLFIKYG